MYFKYLKYLINHKYNVCKNCFKQGLYLQGLTHDLDKLLPTRFKAYAKYFYGEKTEEIVDNFEISRLQHINSSKHHWQYWILVTDKAITPYPMPEKYVIEMLADWKAVNDDDHILTRHWYYSARNNMSLHPVTKYRIESLLQSL